MHEAMHEAEPKAMRTAARTLGVLLTLGLAGGMHDAAHAAVIQVTADRAMLEAEAAGCADLLDAERRPTERLCTSARERVVGPGIGGVVADAGWGGPNPWGAQAEIGFARGAFELSVRAIAGAFGPTNSCGVVVCSPLELASSASLAWLLDFDVQGVGARLRLDVFSNRGDFPWSFGVVDLATGAALPSDGAWWDFADGGRYRFAFEQSAVGRPCMFTCTSVIVLSFVDAEVLPLAAAVAPVGVPTPGTLGLALGAALAGVGAGGRRRAAAA